MEEVSKEGYVENMESSSSMLKSVGTNAQSFGCCEWGPSEIASLRLGEAQPWGAVCFVLGFPVISDA